MMRMIEPEPSAADCTRGATGSAGWDRFGRGVPRRRAVFGLHPQILRILAAASAPASFEIIGLDGAAYPGILRAENAASMALVNHTWTHVGLALLPADRWPAEVDRTSSLLRGVTRHPVWCLRLPYGLSDPAVDARLCVRDLAELDRNVDPSDYLRPGAAVIAGRMLAALHPGA